MFTDDRSGGVSRKEKRRRRRRRRNLSSLYPIPSKSGAVSYFRPVKASSPWASDYDSFRLAGTKIAPAKSFGKGTSQPPKPPSKKKAPVAPSPPKRVAGRMGRGSAGITEQQQLAQVVDQILADAAAGGSFDYETTLREANKAIRQAYAAEIGAIRRGNVKARQDTRRSRKEVEGMYRALARSYLGGMKNAYAMGDKEAADMTALANAAQEGVKKSSNQITEEEANLLKGLGVEAAAPDIINPQNAQLKKDLSDIALEGTQDAAREQGFANAQARWMQRGGKISRTEGANRSADLLSELQDYIFDAQNQIKQLRGQRRSELTSTRLDLMNQANQAASESAQQMFENRMGALEFLQNVGMDQAQVNLDANKLRLDRRELKARMVNDQQKNAIAWAKLQNSAGNNPYGKSSIGEALFYIDGNSVLNRRSKERVKGVMKILSNTWPFKQNKFYVGNNPSGEKLNLTPEKAAEFAQSEGRKQGLNRAEIEALKLAVMQWKS